MRFLWLLLLLAGCAARHARTETRITHGYKFEGPKRIALVANDDDRQAFESVLISAGFRVAEGMTDNEPGTRARYSLRVDGVCGGYGWNVPTLKAEGFDALSNQKVFDATVFDATGCPDTFFRDVAASLNRNWQN